MNSIYIGQSGRSLRVRIEEHRNACKSQDLRSKIFQHSIDLDHKPNFSNPSILIKNCDNTVKRIFLEAFFTKSFKFTINEASCVPSEYAVFV